MVLGMEPKPPVLSKHSTIDLFLAQVVFFVCLFVFNRTVFSIFVLMCLLNCSFGNRRLFPLFLWQNFAKAHSVRLFLLHQEKREQTLKAVCAFPREDFSFKLGTGPALRVAVLSGCATC